MFVSKKKHAALWKRLRETEASVLSYAKLADARLLKMHEKSSRIIDHIREELRLTKEVTAAMKEVGLLRDALRSANKRIIDLEDNAVAGFDLLAPAYKAEVIRDYRSSTYRFSVLPSVPTVAMAARGYKFDERLADRAAEKLGEAIKQHLRVEFRKQLVDK